MTATVLAARNRWVAVEDGLVVDEGFERPPAGAVALGDVWLLSGFVDLQCNGVGDVDFMTAELDGFRAAGAALVRTGVTSYLPTLVSAPLDRYGPALDRVADAQADAVGSGLPRIEGVHLEGPFLGGAPGAHPPELLRPMDVEWLAALLDAHPGLVRLVTLAPEADPGLAGIRMLRDRGVAVALGHSRCSYDEALAAAAAGATLVTHVFNGMGPLHHRAPGLVNAALDPGTGLTPTLIADLVHLHPSVVRLVMAVTSAILVTDRVATGVDSFGQHVGERDGAAFLSDGTLTGSTLTMDRAVRNAVREGVEPETAFDAASGTPADELDLDVYASSTEGGRADLVALDRETLEVEGVWCSGQRAYTRRREP
ncbi:MAG: N-acetylglucosamine-6-phosphate deacetylase [Actinobacteria bacterium]|nr:N-acetylglucosamine-6-phosphate deacetylase [Actinomycetota bacterium]